MKSSVKRNLNKFILQKKKRAIGHEGGTVSGQVMDVDFSPKSPTKQVTPELSAIRSRTCPSHFPHLARFKKEEISFDSFHSQKQITARPYSSEKKPLLIFFY